MIDPLTRVGVDWMALKQHSGASITERSIHHVGVTSDPAYVRHTGKDLGLLRMIVKGILWTRI